MSSLAVDDEIEPEVNSTIPFPEFTTVTHPLDV
jgi:hypothetical protein